MFPSIAFLHLLLKTGELLVIVYCNLTKTNSLADARIWYIYSSSCWWYNSAVH